MYLFKKSSWLMALALISAVLVSGCQATEVPADWRAECVGRMQLSLPQEVELATSSLENFRSHYLNIGFEQGTKPANFEFADGEVAINDNLMKIRFVSDKLTPEDISKLRNQFWSSYNSRLTKAKKSNELLLKNSKYKELVRGDKDMDAYSVRNETEHLSVLEGHAISYTLPNIAIGPLMTTAKK
jgi:hypothetical protein